MLIDYGVVSLWDVQELYLPRNWNLIEMHKL